MRHASGVIRALALGALVTFTACQAPRSNDAQDPLRGGGGNGNFLNGGGGGIPSFNSGGANGTGATGTVDTTAQTGKLEDALSKAADATSDPQQSQALQDAKSVLASLGQDYNSLNSASTPSAVQALFPNFKTDRQRELELAQLFNEVGLGGLAQVFYKLGHKFDVLRFYNPQINRHFYSLNRLEGFVASAIYGYHLEGVGFRVYDQPIEDCNKPIFRCYHRPNYDYFLSTDPACEGQEVQTPYPPYFGYICPSQRGDAWLPLTRLLHPSGGHLESIDPNEIQATQAAGWQKEMVMGFTPN